MGRSHLGVLYRPGPIWSIVLVARMVDQDFQLVLIAYVFKCYLVTILLGDVGLWIPTNIPRIM